MEHVEFELNNKDSILSFTQREKRRNPIFADLYSILETKQLTSKQDKL